jgi:CRP/FNR family transcriptional regulator
MTGCHPADAACARCAVRDRALCAALSDAELSRLNRAAVRRRLARGDRLFHAGEEARCGNVISGVLKLSTTDAEGREQIVALAFPGDFVGRLSGVERHDIAALGPAELCLFPRAAMADALDRSRSMERLLTERTRASMDDARDRLGRWLRGPADERVLALLHELSRHAGGPRFTLPMTRGDMADALGLTLETVSRSMSRLKASGRIGTTGRTGVVLVQA